MPQWLKNGRRAAALWGIGIAFFAGIATIADGTGAWDQLGIPRWAWRSELVRVSEDQTKIKLQVYKLQKKDAADWLAEFELIKAKLKLANEPMPRSLEQTAVEKQEEIDAIEKEIARLTGAAP